MNAVQKQLEKMACFMADTPHPCRWKDETYWAGPVPFALVPQDYDPELVAGDGDKPVAVVWYEYLLDLENEARRIDNTAMLAHLEAAKELPIGDLIAISREAANDYWRGVIRQWDAQYAS